MIKLYRLMKITQPYLLVISTIGICSATVNSRPVQESNIAQLVEDGTLVSSNGKSLIILTTSNKAKRDCTDCPRIYFQAALHGNETLTSEFVFWLFNRIDSGESPISSIPTHLIFDFLPKANPDSFNRRRSNARGINLNRNFSVNWGVSREPAGTGPFSEPETLAIKKFIEKNKYLMTIDIHGYVNWIVTPSPMNNQNPRYAQRSPVYRKWLEIIQSKANLLEDYAIKDALSLGDGGAFEDWAFWEAGSLAFCLEITSPNERDKDHKIFFERYETFLFKIITEALALDQGLQKNQIASHTDKVESSFPIVKKNDN